MIHRPCVPVLLWIAWLLWPLEVRALVLAEGQSNMSASLAVVDGHPAVLWSDNPRTAVQYLRAEDPEGRVWGAPVKLFESSESIDTGWEPLCLREVNGRPAVCYYLEDPPGLRFQRAANATGTGAGGWQPAVVLHPAARGHDVTMEMVGGRPAVVFNPGGNLIYMRALDAEGTAWGFPVILSSPVPIRSSPSLRVVQGRPVVSWGTDGKLFLQSAADAGGVQWNPPQTVATGVVQASASMQVVDGRPALVWWNEASGLKYMRAADDAGTLWPVARTLSSDSALPAFGVVGGKPALAWQKFASLPIQYRESIDNHGSAWLSPVEVKSFSGDAGSTGLEEVAGAPAVLWSDVVAQQLNYLRSSPAGWPPELGIEATRGNPGGLLAEVGGKASAVLKATNGSRDSAPLVFESLTITGPDASEFVISNPPQVPLPARSSTSFTVDFVPVSPGKKTALLQVYSNDQLRAGPYEIPLNGETLPYITVEGPAGVIPRNGTLRMPSTLPGATRNAALSIRNLGEDPLLSVQVSIFGPYRDEFTVTQPVSPVPPGGSSSFTLHYSPVWNLVKSVTLTIVTGPVASPGTVWEMQVKCNTGTRDPSFSPIRGFDRVQAIALRPDGSILVGSLQTTLSLLRPDGSPDPSFFSPNLNGGSVRSIAALTDGKVLIGGTFSGVNGQARPGLARLHADGSLDMSFVPDTPADPSCFAVQRDGRVLVGGDGVFPGGSGPGFLARVGLDGTREAEFSAIPDHGVLAVAIEADGSILAGGNFTRFDDVHTSRLARFDAIGGMPHTYGAMTSDTVHALAVQSDGRVIAGGNFPDGALRLRPDGTQDVFQSFPAASITAVALQADGACLLGRTARSAAVYDNGLARVTPAGTLDPGFAQVLSLYDSRMDIRQVVLQADGSILLAGQLPFADGAFPSLVRLLNDPAVSTLQTEGRHTVRWMRGGTAPEVRDAAMDVRPAGAAEWTPLGFAARIPGGWELSGLTLPPSCTVRARAYADGSIIEQTTPLLTPFESWRLQFFNTANNSGDAADDADPDKDGLTNFTEFAFGLNPVDRAGNALPEFQYAGGSFTATFTVPEGRGDLLYSAEWSPTMEPGTWSVIPDTGAGEAHRFSVSGGGEKMFVRIVVKTQ